MRSQWRKLFTKGTTCGFIALPFLPVSSLISDCGCCVAGWLSLTATPSLSWWNVSPETIRRNISPSFLNLFLAGMLLQQRKWRNHYKWNPPKQGGPSTFPPLGASFRYCHSDEDTKKGTQDLRSKSVGVHQVKEAGELESRACLQAQSFPAAEIVSGARARRAEIILVTSALWWQNTQ